MAHACANPLFVALEGTSSTRPKQRVREARAGAMVVARVWDSMTTASFAPSCPTNKRVWVATLTFVWPACRARCSVGGGASNLPEHLGSLGPNAGTAAGSGVEDGVGCAASGAAQGQGGAVANEPDEVAANYALKQRVETYYEGDWYRGKVTKVLGHSETGVFEWEVSFHGGSKQVLCASEMRLPKPTPCRDPGLGDAQDETVPALGRLNTHGYVEIYSLVSGDKLGSLAEELCNFALSTLTKAQTMFSCRCLHAIILEKTVTPARTCAGWPHSQGTNSSFASKQSLVACELTVCPTMTDTY